jgi:alcohol dehydrogenase (cytochrome c)
MIWRLCALLIAAIASALSVAGALQARSAQGDVSGRWRIDPAPERFPWTAVLRVYGTRVIGAVSNCASGGAMEIAEGSVDGNVMTLRCVSGDGDRTLTFKGTVEGSRITFAWTKTVRAGNDRPNDPVFGAASAGQFTVARVPAEADATAALAAAAPRPPAVTFERIRNAAQEPENWLTYAGSLAGLRHSALNELTPENVKDLELAWLRQMPGLNVRVQATPIVDRGVMYTVQPPNDVIALDAATGRQRWIYSHKPLAGARASGGGGRPNRGLAILGDTVYLGTIDAHLLAIDAYSGKLRWDTVVANAADPACGGRLCYVITHAPLVLNGKIIVGVGGGEGPIRGFIAAFDAATGKEIWRFHTVPAPGEPGNDTWAGDSWKTGGAGVWVTGAYDPELNLTYWGTGNPFPAVDGAARAGDNLYSDSVVALDADTGRLKWHYQFTPHDEMDWDSAQTPALVDLDWRGRRRKVMLWANRNGLMYVLDRSTGEFLMGKPFVAVNWTTGFDAKGRPQLSTAPRGEKHVILPGISPTNWCPPSYSPVTGLFYIPSWERGATSGAIPVRGSAYGAMRAFDPKSGERKWEFKVNDGVFLGGALTTASNLLFTGVWGDFYSEPAASRLVDGYFYALDARTGQQLWKTSLAGSVQGPAITYSTGGRQFVVVAGGNTLFAFALRR